MAELGSEPEEAKAESELKEGNDMHPPSTMPQRMDHQGQQSAKDKQAGGSIDAPKI